MKVQLENSHHNSLPLVSIIIPCYNHGLFLTECIDSVLNSTYKNIEIFVVDDGSDNIETINYFENFPFKNCKVIKQKNQGPSAARNNGINCSNGKYILPLDADDKIGKNYISLAVETMENDNNIGLTYCNAEYFGTKTGKWNLPAFSLEKILQENIIFNCALYRRADYNETKGYDTKLLIGWEDWDFWLSLLERNIKVHKLNSVEFFYRILENSRERKIKKSQLFELRKHIFVNHLNLYLSEMTDPISLYFENEENKEFKRSFEMIKNSMDYKIGKMILSPIRKIRNLIR